MTDDIARIAAGLTEAQRARKERELCNAVREYELWWMASKSMPLADYMVRAEAKAWALRCEQLRAALKERG